MSAVGLAINLVEAGKSPWLKHRVVITSLGISRTCSKECLPVGLISSSGASPCNVQLDDALLS